MLLTVDIGNTETTIGLFSEDKLIHTFRTETKLSETADEVAVDLKGLLELARLSFDQIEGVCISSVVPRCTQAYRDMVSRYLKARLVVVEPGVRTGVPILYDNPHEVGADRVANAVALKHDYGTPGIVVDFGTATTFDVVNEKGEYLGGAIYPGIMTAAEALFSRAARLSKVELNRPARAVGRNTAESIQSGLIYGNAAMVDGFVDIIARELSESPVVVATGGLCELFKGISRRIQHFEPFLTLKGLRLIFQMNS